MEEAGEVMLMLATDVCNGEVTGGTRPGRLWGCSIGYGCEWCLASFMCVVRPLNTSSIPPLLVPSLVLAGQVDCHGMCLGGDDGDDPGKYSPEVGGFSWEKKDRMWGGSK